VQLFFAINQHLPDGSAHALYCFRHCWWLAKARPEHTVRLVFPAGVDSKKVYAYYGLPGLPNLRLKSLPAVRRARGSVGLTIDLVYFYKLYRYVLGRCRPGDWLVSASFPKLLHFLQKRTELRSRLRCGYEVHDLVRLSGAPSPASLQLEQGILSGADCLFTTTQPLERLLRADFGGKPIYNVGLACGYQDCVAPRERGQAGQAFTLAYIGSVYREQGVEWLIREWAGVGGGLPVPLRLEIVGGYPAEIEKLRRLAKASAADGVTCHGPLPPAELPGFLRQVDALVLPTLPAGRMPYVAITKAYDYLGLNRPVLAADLETITDVMRPRREALPFTAGDPASLKAALLELLTTPALGQRLTERAARRAAELSWAKRAETWWEAIAQPARPNNGGAICTSA
jgi:glycosyltransferase involved in cell wall biosynthesis